MHPQGCFLVIVLNKIFSYIILLRLGCKLLFIKKCNPATIIYKITIQGIRNFSNTCIVVLRA